MSTAKVLDLPVPGSGCGDIRVTFENLDLVAEYEYRLDGKDWIGRLRFKDVVAFRYRDEMRSAGSRKVVTTRSFRSSTPHGCKSF